MHPTTAMLKIKPTSEAKMRDTITIGSIAGCCGTIVMTLYKWILLLFGLKFISTWETAAHIILNHNLIHTPIGYLTGYTMQFILGSIFGIVVAYMLRATGKDFYLIKGIGVGAIVWLSSVGFFMRLLHIELQGRGDSLTNFLTIFDWIILGVISSSVVAKYARFT
jgi:hypothetical protein